MISVMKLCYLNWGSYAGIVKNTYFYNLVAFHDINKGKEDDVRYMIFRGARNKLEIIAGIVGNVMKFPYSAPFSMFDRLHRNIEVEEMEQAFEELETYCLQSGIGEIMFCFPQRPMNYLAYQLYMYYAKKGIRILNIGPSLEKGIPNYGLCSYKESIGCVAGSKYTYRKKIIKKESGEAGYAGY